MHNYRSELTSFEANAFLPSKLPKEEQKANNDPGDKQV
jgi:hypothetical protein